MNWKKIIKEEKNKDYYKNLLQLIEEDSLKYKIYPEKKIYLMLLNIALLKIQKQL